MKKYEMLRYSTNKKKKITKKENKYQISMHLEIINQKFERKQAECVVCIL